MPPAPSRDTISYAPRRAPRPRDMADDPVDYTRSPHGVLLHQVARPLLDCVRRRRPNMTLSGRLAGLVVVVAALSVSPSAQWQLQPSPSVPRMPNGQPNLTAPVPRTADGKPDLTGTWANPWATAGRGGRGATPPPKVSLDEIPEA